MYSKECALKRLINSIFLVTALLLTSNISAAPILINFKPNPSVQQALTGSGFFGGTNSSGINGIQILRNFTSQEYVFTTFSFLAGEEVLFTSTNENYFSLLGLDIIGVWGQQTTNIRGSSGNDILFTKAVPINQSVVERLTLNWSDLTAFSIVTGNDFVPPDIAGCCDGLNLKQIAFANIEISNEGKPSEHPSAVPEPGSFFLLALGFIGLAFARRQTT